MAKKPRGSSSPFVAFLFLLAACAPVYAASVDLSRAAVVIRSGEVPEAERTAASVLVEEVEKRTGVRLNISTAMPKGAPAIILASRQGTPDPRAASPELRPEGYRLSVDTSGAAPSVRIEGADPRGVLFGVGAFLRRMDWGRGKLGIDGNVSITTSPASPIRGHQLGYRSTANSWDAWTVPQFEQYIRELVLYGVNSIENIPQQDARQNPLMKVSRRDMNRAMSAICRKYGLDYWVWTPAEIGLDDAAKRAELLTRFEEVFEDSAVLTGVFVPGGDPGHNPPELLLPLLEDVAPRLAKRHPKAKIWLSLQGFNAQREEAVYRYIEEKQPPWLGGLVAGPSSPPIARTRQRLPARYQLRLYPDITHNKICQYQVPDWDQAYALTLGREAINPRPAEYALIHNRYAAMSDGFISYSDGVHDDVNKVIWSALGWDPSQAVRDILMDYARLYFEPALAAEIADAILALERNWNGPLVHNGSVEATLLLWRRLEQKAPQLEANWRWQMCLLRAVYDTYIRRRLIYERGLEEQVNGILAKARERGADRAVDASLAVLRRATAEPVSPELRARIVDLCEKLFQSIGLQTSVEKYHASGAERGAVLDFVDYPLNNRWWLEDEFQKIRALPSESDKVRRLAEIAAWENPGPGSYYDDVGNMIRSPRVDGDQEVEPESFRRREPLFWWWDQGMSRARLSWQATMWPRRVVYEGLDPNATYVVRTGGYGQSLLRIDDQPATPVVDGKLMGEYKEFPVAPEHIRDRRLVLTWAIPTDEGHLNWRQRSRLAEVWLLKRE